MPQAIQLRDEKAPSGAAVQEGTAPKDIRLDDDDMPIVDVASQKAAPEKTAGRGGSSRGYRHLIENNGEKNQEKRSGGKGLIIGAAIALVVVFAFAALVIKIKETVSTIAAGVKTGMDRPVSQTAPTFNVHPSQFGANVQPLPKPTGFTSYLPGSFAARSARFAHRTAPHEPKHHAAKSSSARHAAKQTPGHLFVPSEMTFAPTNPESNPETLQ
jgi:hypothetical protein